MSYKFKVSDASIGFHVSSREQLWCKSEHVQVWDLSILAYILLCFSPTEFVFVTILGIF